MAFQILILVDMKSNILTRKKEVADKVCQLPSSSPDKSGFVNDEIFGILYSPQENGLPDLSLGLVFSGKARPEVQQYADNMLLQTPSQGQYMTADEAIEFTPRVDLQFGREREVYMQKVAKQFQKYMKKHENVE